MIPQPISMTDEEYQLLDELISKLCGIHFPEPKRSLLESRLNKRLQSLQLKRFIDYYMMLQYGANGELDRLTNAVTNNETYFFRETQQIEALFREFDAVERDSAVPGTVRLLCAGCSSGEEAYTLQIYAQTHRPGGSSSRVTVDAFDIDLERVKIARRAEYRPRSIRTASEAQIRDYFTRSGPELYTLKPQFRKNVSFTHGNIVDRATYPSAEPYDVIFCRNVLIYFSEVALRRTIDNFARSLRPGGLLFLGHSESIIGMSELFDTRRVGKCIAYERTRR